LTTTLNKFCKGCLFNLVELSLPIIILTSTGTDSLKIMSLYISKIWHTNIILLKQQGKKLSQSKIIVTTISNKKTTHREYPKMGVSSSKSKYQKNHYYILSNEKQHRFNNHKQKIK